MKNSAKKFMCSVIAATAAFPLVACSTETPESAFDSPLPWHVSDASYEKLDYTVAVYNTENGAADDKRVQIGEGVLSFTLEEGKQNGYTLLGMDFSVTYYSADAAGKDKGLTDTITSSVYFEPNSLTASSMQKDVNLADREDETNLSYSISADYFNAHEATFLYTKQKDAAKQTLSLPRNAVRDNEMLFFLARAQAIGAGSGSNFKMVNLYDSFIAGKVQEYRMGVSGVAERKTVIGDFVKDFGIEQVTENDKTAYPVNCVSVSIAISGEKHGPSYSVLYATGPFVQGEQKHNKIPISIEYSSYIGANPYRLTTYTLSACSFTKAE